MLFNCYIYILHAKDWSSIRQNETIMCSSKKIQNWIECVWKKCVLLWTVNEQETNARRKHIAYEQSMQTMAKWIVKKTCEYVWNRFNFILVLCAFVLLVLQQSPCSPISLDTISFCLLFFFKNNFFFHTDSLPHIVSTPQLTIAISLSLSLFYIFFKKEEQLSFFVRWWRYFQYNYLKY